MVELINGRLATTERHTPLAEEAKTDCRCVLRGNAGKLKNQYFGDVKDLFKYDLVEELIRGVPELKQFAFIPMLTAPDTRNDGNKVDYKRRAGSMNRELCEYLQTRVERGVRDIVEIKKYYRTKGIPIEIYGESEYFNHRNRYFYFKGIPNGLLKNSVILLDPDNGLEIKKSNERHVLRSEVADLYGRMSNTSVLVVFQHFRREKHELTLTKVGRELGEACGVRPLWIYDKEIIFYLLARQHALKRQVEQVLDKYGNRYGLLKIGP